MQILNKTFITEDEGWDTGNEIVQRIEAELKRVKFDSYNHQYVVRFSLDTVDELEPAPYPEDEGE